MEKNESKRPFKRLTLLAQEPNIIFNDLVLIKSQEFNIRDIYESLHLCVHFIIIILIAKKCIYL